MNWGNILEWAKKRKILSAMIVLFVIGLISLAFESPTKEAESSPSIKNQIEVSKADRDKVLKEVLDYEINEKWQNLDTTPICFEYLIEEDWVRLRCDKNLTIKGMELVVGEIEESILQKWEEPIRVHVAFKDLDYKTLKTFTIESK